MTESLASQLAQQEARKVALRVATEVSAGRLPSEVASYIRTNPPKPGSPGADGEDGLTWRGPWRATVTYAVGDAVESEGSSYVAVRETRGERPPTSSWDLLAKKGEPGRSGGGGGGGSSGSTLSNATPLIEFGLGAPGVGADGSRDDHVHPAAVAGSGAVDSVNGETGVVVLDAADVGAEVAGAAAAAVGTHAGLSDPHPGYLTPAEGDAAYDALGAAAAVSTTTIGAVPTARTITAGTGLTGGGDLSANRTLAADFGSAAGKVTQGDDARLSDARAPTGNAGGDLSGTYPNPGVVDDSHAHTAATVPAGATSGTATIDFGAFPGSGETALAITGQAAILSGSLVEAWIRPATTADHSSDEHRVETLSVIAADIVAATGFTIYGMNTSPFDTLLWGTWSVAWTWV